MQGVDEDGVSSESTSKVITDINEIQAFVEKLNKLEVVQLPNKELLEKSKELNKKGNYFFIGCFRIICCYLPSKAVWLISPPDAAPAGVSHLRSNQP